VPFRPLTAAAALLLLSSCAGLGADRTAAPSAGPTTATPHAVAQDPDDLWNRSFVAVRATLNGQPNALDFLHVVFDEIDGVIRWVVCNYTGVRADITSGRLEVRAENPFRVGRTEIGCPPELDEQLSASVRFFLEDPAWRLQGARLTLWSGDSIIELDETEHDRALPDAPAELLEG
jgi:hypothetical protein